ncbi:MAG TPA: hypothetical protein VJQ59_06820 [Candidatus Sulfotelmatobacter sp.]|nr:hypothetical protein [Terriglobales bacterium]HKT88129.1 hypothetical protein [Candidatus Sulfotelmatobacter sp.]
MKSFSLTWILLIGSALYAQVSPEHGATARSENDARPLTWREGAAIIENARENTSQIDPEEDCSHLVHDLYDLAGLHYTYAPSMDLYRGVDSFERVRTPQPGDLIVWRGHVGLVVDPSQHSFYSSLSTGPKVDTYNSPAWRRRGPVRFFRYLVHAGERVRSGPNTLRAAADDSSSATLELDSDEPKSAPKPVQAPLKPEYTEVVFLNRERPTKAAFEQAMLQLWSNPSDERQDRWEEASDVVIVESLKIERLHLQASSGTVDAKIRAAGHLTADAADGKSSTQAVRFHLVRYKNGWRVDDPSGRMYLSGNAAVIAVSDRLSGIARDNGPRAEQVQTANLLKAILR